MFHKHKWQEYQNCYDGCKVKRHCLVPYCSARQTLVFYFQIFGRQINIWV